MKLELDYNEIKRYLKYDKQELDEQSEKNIANALALLDKFAQPKYTYKIFDIEVSKSEVVIIDSNIIFSSKNLATNLKQCHKAIFLVATLGLELDYQIKRLEINDLALAYVLNACAVEYLEKYLDYLQANILNKDYYQKSRFSIGYGDLALANQSKMINLVEATKLIGVNVLKSHLMVPSKSVSAIIGISNEEVYNDLSKCDDCLPNGKCSGKCLGKEEI